MPPRLIYGTSQKGQATCDLVVKAVLKGFRALDSSCQPMHYSEAGVGQALLKLQHEHGIKREDLFLQTRFSPFQDYLTCPYDVNCPLALQVHRSLQVSLSDLQTSYVDVFFLHAPLQPFEDMLRVWNAMEHVVEDEGKAKQLGICNIHDIGLFQRLYQNTRIKPTVVQNRLYANTKFDRDLRDFCVAKEIEYQAFWVLTANWPVVRSPEVAQVAAELGLSPEQVVFRFWLHEGASLLCGTTSERHMEQAVCVAHSSAPALSPKQLQAIRQVMKVLK